MAEKVLVILPHPDDEAFGVAGTIAQYVEKGVPVTYACCTLGEMGRNMGNPPIANRETLPLMRKKELQEACNVLGISDLRMLGYRDKTLEFEDEDKVANHFLEIIKDVNPTVIITFYPEYSIHPDHDACGRAVVKAVKQMAKTNRPKVHCVAITSDREEKLGSPDIVNDVSDVAEKKIACIRAHETQVEGFMSGLSEKLLKKDPEIMNWINVERFWTYQVGE